MSVSSSRTRGDHLTLPEHEQVVEPRRDLLHVVRHHHDRRRGGVSGELAEGGHHRLPAAEVQAGRGLVEQQEAGLGEEGAGQQHPLALARGERADGAVGVALDTHAGQGLHGRGAIVVRVPVPPRLQRGVPRRHHRVEGAELRSELIRQGCRREADPLPHGADVAAPEGLAEHLDRAAAGVQVQPRDLDERRLAAAVGAQDDPALAAADLPGEGGEDGPALTDQADPGQTERGRAEGLAEGRHGPETVPAVVGYCRGAHAESGLPWGSAFPA